MLRISWLAICTLALNTSCTPGGESGGGSTDDVVVSIDSGGQIEFQGGTLSSDATVELAAAPAPRLPLGVEAVGEALLIKIDQATTRPLTIRLPVPAGQDPDTLGIYLVLEDGSTTLLSTTVEDDFLVAATDAFTAAPELDSTASARTAQGDFLAQVQSALAALGARIEQNPVPEVSAPRQGTIVGPTFLAPGQVGMFNLTGFGDVSADALHLEWTLYASGGSLLVPTEDSSAGLPPQVTTTASRFAQVVVDDNASASRFDLTCSYVDPASGTAGLATKAVSIQAAADLGELVLIYLQGVPEYFAGVPGAEFLIGVFNLTNTTASFDWDYGAEDIGGTGAQGNIGLTVRVPSYTYEEPGDYVLTVSATAMDGSTGEIAIPITVREDRVEVIIEGPAVIQPIAGPFDTDTYTVKISNGEPPFTLATQLFPSTGSPSTQTTEEREVAVDLALREPGSYVFQATVTDANEQTASYVRPLTVERVEPPVAELVAETDTVTAGTPVNFSYFVLGGVLLANGVQSSGYSVEIDWGDGQSASFSADTGTVKIGATGALPHTYTEPDTYTAEIRATDAAGVTATGFAVVTVEEEVDCPVSCQRDSDCITANAGAACVDECCFECENDNDCEGGATCDETLVCVGGCTECCGGDMLCEVIDDCSDPDCALCQLADGVCIEECDPKDPDCRTVVNITSQGSTSASSSFSSDFSVGNATDGTTTTNWFSDGSSGGDAEVFTWVKNSEGDDSITRIELDPETFQGGGDFGFNTVRVLVINELDVIVYDSDFIGLPGQRVDLNRSTPEGTEGRTVQVTLVGHQQSSCGGFAEFRVFGLR